MRATFNTTYRSLNSELFRLNRNMEDLRIALASGKKVQKPSDEPTSIRPILNARTQIKGYERYLTNIDTGLNRVDTTDVHLDAMENTMVRAKEIAVAATNGSLGATDLATYADEVSQLRQSMLDSANAQFDGEYLFSGYLVTDASMGGNPPFVSAAGSVAYNGDNNRFELEISPTERLVVGVPGNGFLQPNGTGGAGDVFQTLTDLETALRNGIPADVAGIQAAQADIDSATEQIRVQRSLLGNIGKRLEDARSQTELIQIDKKELLSNLEDADMLELASSLRQQELALQGALSITSRVGELSILDYL